MLVDSSVVLDLFTDDPVWAAPSLEALATARLGGTELVIDPMVYAEVSSGFSRVEDLERAIAGAGFAFEELPREALFLAAKAFVAYRRRGGERRSPLPDFFIGAHAAVRGWPLLTRGARRVRAAYPHLELIEPKR